MKKSTKGILLVCLILMIGTMLLTACEEHAENQMPTNDTPSGTSAPTSTQHIHAYGQWSTTKEATCSEEGVQERVCACGAIETQRIEMEAHTPSEWIVDAEPDCDNEGKRHKECTVCSTSIITETLPTTHDMYQHKCQKCNYEDTYIVARDVSEKGDKSVMAYLYDLGDETYELCFFGSGKVSERCNLLSAELENKTIVSIVYGEGITHVRCPSINALLTNISLPSTTQVIENGAFYSNIVFDCALVLPKDLVRIEDWAFCGTVIRDLLVPDSVEYIGENAFASVIFGRIDFEGHVSDVRYGAFRWAQVSSYLHDDEISIIETETATIDGCQYAIYSDNTNHTLLDVTGDKFSYSEIIVKDGTKILFNECFRDCIYVQNIRIPNTVTYIGDLAFFYCYNLEKIIFQGTKAEWDAISKGGGWAYYNTHGNNGYEGEKTIILECEDGTFNLTLWDGGFS